MKKTSKLLSLILMLCIILSPFHTTIYAEVVADHVAKADEIFALPDIIEKEEALENGYIGRVKAEEKGLYTFVFANSDGTHTMRIYDYPVKYIAEDHSVRDISLDIEANSNGGYSSADHEIVTTFESRLSDGISLKYKGMEISMIPEFEYIGQAPIPELTNNDKNVIYKLDNTTSLVYELTYTGFKEDIVVQEYTGQTEYKFTIFTNGLSICEENGSYYLSDDEGNIKAFIGDIIIFTADDKNNTFGSLSSETVCMNQEYSLTIHLDAEYLADPQTAYPIRIDPTIEINYSNNGSGAIEDVTINSLTGSNGSSGSLSVGQRKTYGVSRILMRFPGLEMSSLPGSYQISAASIEMRDLLCESEELQIYCHVFNGNTWTESTATWENVSANSYGVYLSSKNISYENGTKQSTAHRYSFNILGAVRGWKSGTYNKNKGIIFKASNTIENGTGYICKTFASYNRSSYKPSLSITYRTISNVATITGSVYTVTNQTLKANYAYKFTFTPAATDKYSFWTVSNINTHISVYGNSLLSSNIGANDNSGHDLNGCLTLSLTAGKTYYILVQGSTTTNTGLYTFKIRRGLPMSGYEELSNLAKFNSNEYLTYNNCYTYALNTLVNPVTGNKYGRGGCNPGKISGNPITVNDLADAETAKQKIVAAVKADCVAWGGNSGDFYEVSENAMVPEGYYKVMLVLAPGVDYHWYRQVSDVARQTVVGANCELISAVS